MVNIANGELGSVVRARINAAGKRYDTPALGLAAVDVDENFWVYTPVDATDSLGTQYVKLPDGTSAETGVTTTVPTASLS